MKKVKSLCSTALALAVFTGSLNAQLTPVTGSEVILDKLRFNKTLEGNSDINYGDIQGDPFIFKDFQKGTLYILPDQQLEVNIRYDIFADQMHIRQKDQIYALVHPEKVKLIDVDRYKFIYSKYKKSPEDKDPEQGSYFIQKVDGKCMLLVKKNLRVQDAEPAKLYQEAKPPKFIDTGDTYFLKLGENSAVRFHDKKEITAILGDKKPEITGFIKSNKLDIRKIDDLAKIVSYYNSL